MFSPKVKFPMFRLTIAMVWNNSINLFAFINSASTSSTNFGVLVYVKGSINPFAKDPSSSTILLPSSNSNGNPSMDSSLLSGTSSFVNMNSSKVGCFAILSICSYVSYRPSCVCCCCYYNCCSKCCKCCGLVVVAIQSSYTFASKCKTLHLLKTLCHL